MSRKKSFWKKPETRKFLWFAFMGVGGWLIISGSIEYLIQYPFLNTVTGKLIMGAILVLIGIIFFKLK